MLKKLCLWLISATLLGSTSACTVTVNWPAPQSGQVEPSQAQQNMPEPAPAIPDMPQVPRDASPQSAISAALAYYCDSAPTNPNMWLAYGSTGLYSAVQLSTGTAFYVKLSGGQYPGTSVLRAEGFDSLSIIKSWGCPGEMLIGVIEEDQ